jgi:hypothetical protein
MKLKLLSRHLQLFRAHLSPCAVLRALWLLCYELGASLSVWVTQDSLPMVSVSR